jgi:hypothetical protein
MKAIVIIDVAVEKTPGTNAAAAIHQGWGEEYLLAYLQTKMPAGSPVNIEHVSLVKP